MRFLDCTQFVFDSYHNIIQNRSEKLHHISQALEINIFELNYI